MTGKYSNSGVIKFLVVTAVVEIIAIAVLLTILLVR